MQDTKVQREPLDLKKFGAVGDGITDDTAAIQAAMDDYYQRHYSADNASLNDPQLAQLITSAPSTDEVK